MALENKPDLPYELNREAVSQWLASLPANDRERYTLLFSGLQALNAAKPEPSAYFEVLEMIQMPVQLASANLTSMFIGKSLPMDFGIRKLAKLSVQFEVELSQGYYAIADSQAFTTVFNREEQGAIVHLALTSYSLALLRLALMYEAPSRSIWKQLGALYRLAEGKGLLGWNGPGPGMEGKSECSVMELYLIMLAFRLSSPYRFEQTEIQWIFDFLLQHRHLSRLGLRPVEENKKADFMVDTNSGEISVYPADGEGEESHAMRFLFLEPIRQKLTEMMRSGQPQGPSQRLSDFLRIRMGGCPEFLPNSKGRGSMLYAGYQSLVTAVINIETKIEAGETISDFNLLPLDSHDSPHARLELSKTAGTFTPLSPVKQQTGMAGQGVVSHGIRCRLYPSNIPACYLIEPSGLKLSRGHLYGLVSEDKLIHLGLVCPGLVGGSGSIYGFQLLASQVTIVRAFFSSDPRKHAWCFFSTRADGRLGLLAQPIRLRGGDAISLIRHDKRESYRVVRLREQTAEFCQYEIIPDTAPPSG